VEKREQRGDKWQMMRLGNCCALFPVSDLVLVGGEVQRRLESSLCAKLYSEKRGDALEKNYKRFVVTFIRTKKNDFNLF